jgi:hypothetical protein
MAFSRPHRARPIPPLAPVIMAILLIVFLLLMEARVASGALIES